MNEKEKEKFIIWDDPKDWFIRNDIGNRDSVWWFLFGFLMGIFVVVFL